MKAPGASYYFIVFSQVLAEPLGVGGMSFGRTRIIQEA